MSAAGGGAIFRAPNERPESTGQFSGTIAWALSGTRGFRVLCEIR